MKILKIDHLGIAVSSIDDKKKEKGLHSGLLPALRSRLVLPIMPFLFQTR